MTEVTPAAAAPSGGAWTYRFAGNRAMAPALDGDHVFFPALTTAFPAQPATLSCVDLRTTQLLWQYHAPGEFITPPTIDGNALFVGNRNGGLYAIDLSTHSDLWYPFAALDPILCQPVVSNGIVLFGTTGGRYFGVEKDTGIARWTITHPKLTSEVRPSIAAIVGEWAVFARSKGAKANVTCVKTATGETSFAVDVDRGITADPVVIGNVVYFGCLDGQLLGFSVPDGALVTDVTMGRDPLLGPLATDGEYLYAGSQDGNFYARAVDPANEVVSWELPVTAYIPYGVAVHRGEAFFAGGDSEGRPYFYTLDLASAADQAPEVLVESLGGVVASPAVIQDGRIGFSASGNGSGVVYVFDADEAAMLSRIKFSSRLIVGDYDVRPEATTPTPQRPEFQILITVTDGNEITQAEVRVAIWASAETQLIASDGQTVTLGIDAARAHYETTDSGGQIALTMAGAMGTPSLFLRPDFYEEGYSLQVFPDQETVVRLSGIQATVPEGSDPRLGLDSARGYADQPVVKDAYKSSVEDVAATIRNTVGAQQNVSTTRLTKPAGSARTASSGPAAAASRGIAPGTVPHFIVDFDYDASSMTFSESSPEEIDALRSARMSAAGVKGIAGGFHEFKHAVTKGAKKVKKLTWKHVEEAGSRVAHVVTDVLDETGLTEIYEFVIATVEEAVEVLEGVIKEIVTAITTFIEWLSWLFAWDDILDTKNLIRDRTKRLMTDIRDWAASPAMRDRIKGTVVSLREEADAKFDAAIEALGGKTVSSSQQSVPSKHDAVHPHGVDITGQLNWLLRKLPHPHLVTFDVRPEAVHKLVHAGDLMTAAMDDLFATPAFAQLPRDLERVVADFLQLFEGSPDGVLKQAMADVVAVVEDVVDLLLDFVIALIDTAFDAINECIDAVIEMLDAKIDLGFITDFYKLLGAGDLTLLDAVALITAVPTTLTYKIAEGKKNSAASTGTKGAHDHGLHPVWSKLDLATAFGYLLYVPFAMEEAYADKAKEYQVVGVLNMVQGVLNALVTGLGSAELLDDPNADDYSVNVVFTLFNSIATFVNFYVYFIYTRPEYIVQRDAWRAGKGDGVWAILGTISMGLSAIYAFPYPDDYLGRNGSILISNEGTSLPYFTAFMPSPNWAAALCGAGYGIGMGTSIAFAFQE